MKLYILNKQKTKYIFLSVITTVFVVFLLLNSTTLSTNLKLNVELFLYKLLPSVFPYIFLTQVLIESGLIYNLSWGLSKFASKLFHIPEVCCPAIIISFLMGYPNAAKYIATLYNNNQIESKQAEQLLGFTSLASPSFVISTLGIAFYTSSTLGIILLVSHILSSLILGILLGIKYKNIIQQTSNNLYILSKKTKGFEIISNSIFGTLKTLGLIFCFMAMFSSIATIVCNTLNLSKNVSCIIMALTEITSGLNALSSSTLDANAKILITSFVLSFGSFMIIYQIYAVSYTCKISLITFLKHKLIQGGLSTIITYVLIKLFKFELPLSPAFSNVQNTSYMPSHFFEIFILTSALVILTIVISMLKKPQKSAKDTARANTLTVKKGDNV